MIRIAVLALLVFASPAVAQPAPHIPFLTNFTYWDHHWLQWLPAHLRFESIEAAVAEVGERRLIRVWLTERAPPKRQTFFFDDEDVARTQGGESFVRRFDYRARVVDGRPADLVLAFDDDRGRPLSWIVRFAAGQTLAPPIGLKPQGGHGADTAFLLFWTGPNAVTMDGALAVADERYILEPDRLKEWGHFYGAAYSRGACNGVLRYGAVTVAPGFRAEPFGFAGAGRLHTRAAGGGLAELRHFFGSRDMTVSFEPPLPRAPSGDYRGQYRIVYDSAHEVLHGRIEGHASGFTWRPDSPAWARGTVLRTDVQPDGDSYRLTLTK